MRLTSRRLCLALTILLITAAPARPGEPDIALEKDRWDFGRAVQGQQLSHALAIRNRGDAPLVISTVRSSCSTCSGSMLDSKVIAPGKKAKLEIRFYTARVSGQQRKSLTIHSNDPDEPFVKVWITGMVVKTKRPVIELEPETWDVGLVAPGQTCVGVVQVLNKGDGPLSLQGIQCSTGCRIVAWPEKPIPPGGAGEIRASLSVGDRNGLIDGYIHVQSNDPAASTGVVRITGYASPAASGRIAPSGLTFTPVEFGPIVPGRGRLVTKYRVANHLDRAAKVDAVPRDGRPVVTPRSCMIPANGTADLTIALPDDFTFQRGGSQAAFTVHLPILAPQE